MTPIYVYILEADRGCKIGISENPRQRARNIATQGGIAALQLIAAVPVLNNIAREIERETHRRLDAYRCIGEWFQIDNKAARDVVDASIIAITNRYALTAHGGLLLPPITTERSVIATPNVIGRFIEDRIEPYDGAQIQARALYNIFVE